ncbi:MAG: biliverdin-producing heme oxygenase [Campylobacterales bacterium]|nr:biliverdin-producing heme oxygenase [Campylobacterales bacterium]
MVNIKEQTIKLHEQLEQQPLLKKLSTGDFDKGLYIEILKRFYGVIISIENSIDDEIFPNKRGELLKEDLKELDFFDSERIETLDISISNLSEMLGFVYVLEGSRNGGIYLCKIIKEKDSSLPCRYFYGMGEKTREYWIGFMGSLPSKIDDQKSFSSGVEKCYQILIDWFSYERS